MNYQCDPVPTYSHPIQTTKILISNTKWHFNEIYKGYKGHATLDKQSKINEADY